MSKEFGLFNIFWNNHPNHMPFLNLTKGTVPKGEWGLKISLNLIEDCNCSEHINCKQVAYQ